MLAVATCAAGCGSDAGGDEAAPPTETGSGPATTPRTDTSPTTRGRGRSPVVTVTLPQAPRAEPTPSGEPTFMVDLTAENDVPRAGVPWRYTVRVTEAGKPIGATAEMRVFAEGKVVDTLGFFTFEGRMTRSHRWPRSLRGRDDVVLQAEVEGEGGTRRDNLPIRVR